MRVEWILHLLSSINDYKTTRSRPLLQHNELETLIRESESPRPKASSFKISVMKSSSVIFPYITHKSNQCKDLEMRYCGPRFWFGIYWQLSDGTAHYLLYNIVGHTPRPVPSALHALHCIAENV